MNSRTSPPETAAAELLEHGSPPDDPAIAEWSAVLATALAPPQIEPLSALESALARTRAAGTGQVQPVHKKPARRLWLWAGWGAAAAFAVLWASRSPVPFWPQKEEKTSNPALTGGAPQNGDGTPSPDDGTAPPEGIAQDAPERRKSPDHMRALPLEGDPLPAMVSVPRAEYELLKAALRSQNSGESTPAALPPGSLRPFLMELTNPARAAGGGQKPEERERQFINRNAPPVGTFTLPLEGLEEIGGGYFYDRGRGLIMEPTGDGRSYHFRQPGPDFDPANPRLAPVPDLSSGRDAENNGYVWVDPATGEGSLILPPAAANAPQDGNYWLWMTLPGNNAPVPVGQVDGGAAQGGSFAFTLPQTGTAPGSFLVTRETVPMPSAPSAEVILRGP